MQKPIFANNEIYHIYNRGVEKRIIFQNNSDYFRFLNNLKDFNSTEIAMPSNIRYQVRRPSDITDDCLGVQLLNNQVPNKKLVDILAFCLMPNHYHLLLTQLVDNGIVKFMQKLGTGYTNYFNLKHERVGPLFQGRFKAVLIEEDKHFKYLPQYIHFNPFDLKMPEWREKKIRNINNALSVLDNYRWSSYQDYQGNNNYPFLNKDMMFEICGGKKEFKKYSHNFLKSLNFELVNGVTLE